MAESLVPGHYTSCYNKAVRGCLEGNTLTRHHNALAYTSSFCAELLAGKKKLTHDALPMPMVGWNLDSVACGKVGWDRLVDLNRERRCLCLKLEFEFVFFWGYKHGFGIRL